MSSSMRVIAATAACLLASGAATALPERPSTSAADAVARLSGATRGALVQRTLPASGYTLLHAGNALPLLADGGLGAPADRAMSFLSLHGAALGVDDAVAELALQRVSRDIAGNTHVHLDQVHRGVPVFGARVVVHMNSLGITGVGGVFLPGLESVSTVPTRSVAQVRQAALNAMRKQHPGVVLTVGDGRWVVYAPGLLTGRLRESRLVYVATVAGPATSAVKESVVVDAHTAAVLNHVSLVPHALNREIYTPDQTVPPLLTEGSLLAPADIPLINDPGHSGTVMSTRATRQPPDNLYIFAGGTYNLYNNLFARDGYDACDGEGPCTPSANQVQKSVYLINDACPNAYWNGDSTNYCPGFDADDIVSHEWSHAYTEYTHGLIYQYQSGALNESYSDIFGEVYDLTNGIEGPLGATLIEHEYYVDGGSRWVVGEDLSAALAAVLLRDMWDPDGFDSPSPGSVRSENYACGTGDNGGVHTNSGVPNHAFAMLVDGKTFNDVVVPGIGMLKASNIYYQAATHYQTPTTNFPQHAASLRAACEDLVGQNLRSLVNGAPTGTSISLADCDAVDLATTAVGMNEAPPCLYLPVLKPESSTPQACGDSDGNPVWTQDWEGGAIPADWTRASEGVNPATWRGANWAISDTLPIPHAGKALFAVNDGAGDCAADDNSGHFSIDSPAIVLTHPNMRLTFTHFMQSEALFDGGNLKVSIDGGAFDVVPDAAFVYNGHSETFDGPAPGGQNTSPLAGEAAWTGSDQGGATGSWGTTIVDLGALGASAGDTLVFRWDFGQDGCGGNLGWFVDVVKVVSCPAPPTLSLGTDYENPDTDGSFTLEWARPAGAVGPDLVQQSTVCEAGFTDDAEEALILGTNSRWEGSPQWSSGANMGGDGSNAYFIAATVFQDEALTLSAPVAIPAGSSSTLKLDTTYGLEEGYDFGYVEVSADAGANWTQLGTVSGPADAVSLGITDTQLSYDLTPYAGESVLIRFRLTSDNITVGATSGWYVDNISITNAAWSDVASPATASTLRSGLASGTYCYRVKTRFPGAGAALIDSPFSNVVSAIVELEPNEPPVANAGADVEVNEGAGVLLSGAGSSDPEASVLTYEWTQLGGPTVSLTAANTATPVFTAPQVAMATDLTFQLTVRDSGGLSDADTVTVTVRDVPGPVAPPEPIGNNSVGGALPPVSLALFGLAALRRRRSR